jgi:hypothetical protein
MLDLSSTSTDLPKQVKWYFKLNNYHNCGKFLGRTVGPSRVKICNIYVF